MFCLNVKLTSVYLTPSVAVPMSMLATDASAEGKFFCNYSGINISIADILGTAQIVPIKGGVLISRMYFSFNIHPLSTYSEMFQSS